MANKRLPGNPYHERAENIRLMHAHLDELKEQQPTSRTNIELLLFEISDRLASLAYEQRTTNELTYANTLKLDNGRIVTHDLILNHLVAILDRMRDTKSKVVDDDGQ